MSGDPAVQCFCHCASCRGWLGAPVHAATLWPAANVRVVKGADKLGLFKKTEQSHRQFCTHCGGHVMNAHPGLGMIDVLAAVIRDFRFAPTMHVHYGEHMLPIRDGLPKYADMPKEFGGSGKTLPE
jgi:hypothetical protein